MQFCKRCLYPQSHPLNITFNNFGICSGCQVHEEKYVINWSKKKDELISILNQYKNTSENNYDCIIPVSGARDSFFIVHTIKKVLGMNPLLVTYNKHYNTDVGARNLAKLRTVFDCDILTVTVNPETVKKITRATLRKMGSIYWHCIAGQTVFPVQIAVKFKIPLIIWGVHQGVDQVGMFSHENEVEMTRKYRKEHDLMGFEAEDLIDDFDSITEADIVQYKYPDDKEIERVGVRGIYLSNFIKWDSKLQHEQMIKLYNYETKKLTRTFDTYNDVDCYNYADVHDYIKLIKHGYGKALDHACREIRLKRLSREEAIQLVKRNMFEPPKHLSLFLDWLGITENSFYYIINQFRNKKFWIKQDDWEWKYNFDILNSIFNCTDDQSICENNSLSMPAFEQTNSYKSTDSASKYILIAKGSE